MVLKLDDRFAIVWRDPFSLQFGVDPAQVVLREVTTADERMIDALRSGVSRSGLEMIASSHGASERDATVLLRALKPLLLPEVPTQTDARVAIVGSGETAERIASALALAGVAVSLGPSATDDAADLGIAVGHYVLDPESYGFWLRRDLPHLAVVFGDESVTIGPLVEPGSTACLYCLEHYRRDADASWSAIASQLWGRHSSAETALTAAETAARVTRLALERLQSGPLSRRAGAGRSYRLSVASGEVTRRDWMPHPECGCVVLPASAGPPGSGSAPDPAPPTTAGAAVSLA